MHTCVACCTLCTRMPIKMNGGMIPTQLFAADEGCGQLGEGGEGEGDSGRGCKQYTRTAAKSGLPLEQNRFEGCADKLHDIISPISCVIASKLCHIVSYRNDLMRDAYHAG